MVSGDCSNLINNINAGNSKMFDFLKDIGTYQDRVVGRSEYDWGFISTAYCSDGYRPYETGIKTSEYARQGNDKPLMIIVEAYDTKEEAKAGHDKWVETMKTRPEYLDDCINCAWAELYNEGELRQYRKEELK